MTSFLRSQSGMSLVELMVSLVAGLIVAGAAVAFTVSSLRANTEYVGATRLTQELRTNLNFVADELRRAGYDENAMNYVAQPATFTGVSPFAPISINATKDCIIYAYDRLPGVPGQLELGNGEMRAIRRATRNVNGVNVGVLEFAESAAGLTPACGGGSPNYTTYPPACHADGWCALSDPRVIDIQAFSVQNDPRLGYDHEYGVIPGSPTTSAMQVRRINVELRGALLNNPDVVRGVRATVRVRSDCVRGDATSPAANGSNVPGGSCVATPGT